jgi:hypothetical protein
VSWSPIKTLAAPIRSIWVRASPVACSRSRVRVERPDIRAVFQASPGSALNDTAGRLGLRVVLREQESYKRLSGLNVLVEHSPTG